MNSCTPAPRGADGIRREGERSWKRNPPRRVVHFPRLDTVIMVEETIKKFGPCTKTELSRRLEKKVMWPTLTLILDYFETMGFIIIDKRGRMVWIYNPDIVKRFRSREDLEWKQGYSSGTRSYKKNTRPSKTKD